MADGATAPMLDPRLNAVRADLADSRLKGRVEAACFVDGAPSQVIAAQTAVRREPGDDATMLTEALCGETLLVFERQDGWAWVQLDGDGYVGWIAADSLTAQPQPAASHRVTARRTFLFARPDIKSRVLDALPLGAMVSVCGEAEDHNARYLRVASGGYVVTLHAAALTTESADDWVSTAESYLGVPYLWGGRTDAGIDCSGLVQIALSAGGHRAPRDSDMQEKALGEALDVFGGFPALRRGDLVFWPGHVGIMADPSTLLHAAVAHMSVAAEPLSAAIDRSRSRGVDLSAIRRLGSA